MEIQLSTPGEAPQTAPLTARIDTGADFTIVPLQWRLNINAPEARSAYVRGIWSERQLVTLYLVDIHFEHGTLAGMEVIGIETEDNITDDEDGDNDDDEPEVILGGNILNLLLLLLEGPQQQTTILEHRPRRF